MLEATITQQIINFLRIEQKGMTFDFDLHSPFLLPSFLGGKRKGEKKNQTRAFKTCLSAPALIIYIFFPFAKYGLCL
jgi:hypothetical protein